jgi:hypothetical protein
MAQMIENQASGLPPTSRPCSWSSRHTPPRQKSASAMGNTNNLRSANRVVGASWPFTEGDPLVEDSGEQAGCIRGRKV